MQRKSIDTPLAEITLRRYERPFHQRKRETVRKLCLSLGLLNPGDSRDIIVDIFYVLLEAKKESKKLSSDEIRQEVLKLRESEGLPHSGTAASNVRRQLRRLREILLVEKIKNDYRITEFSELDALFDEKIEKLLIPSIISRIREYLKSLDEYFSIQDGQH